MVVLAVAVLAAGIAVLVADGGDPLPPVVAGLPAVGGAPEVDGLAARLAADPQVDEVDGRVYDDGTSRVVVLLVRPRDPFGEQAAGRLAAGVVGDARASSTPSRDGRALLTCTGEPASPTCVAVEPEQALVVVGRGVTAAEPLPWLDGIRSEVVSHRR